MPTELHSTSVDKSVLAIPEPRRLRDKVHVKYVSKRPCLICGRQPSDPHHLRFAQQRAVGRKVSDEFIVPLCRTHHREAHRSSDEVAWWKQSGIDALEAAHKLWRKTHTVRNE
jgi:Putative HNHc nuclease